MFDELADGEDKVLLDGTSYEIWSPYDATDAAQTLLDILQDYAAEG